MKKNYIQPVLIALELNLTQQIMAGSVTKDGSGNVTSVGKGGNFSGGSGDVLGHDSDFDW